MPIIKARPNRVRYVRHICHLQEPNRDALVLYARFIGDTVDYVVNQLIYEHVINADKLRTGIAEEERHFRANHRRIVVDKREHLFTTTLKGWSWHNDPTGSRTWAEWAPDLTEVLAAAGIAYTLEHATPPARWPTRSRNSRRSSGGLKTTGCGSSRSFARPSSKASACFSRCSTPTRG
jgi:hypothetical protein